MLSFLPVLVALGAFAGYGSATTYAQFCNDYGCTDSCGISVSVDNPGCLNESGRGSILFHGENSQDVHLLWSPGTDCGCQNECESLIGIGNNDFCYSLEGKSPAQSFRFVGGRQCTNNNC